MKKRKHETVDIQHWICEFPIAGFEKKEGPRKFVGFDGKPREDDPIDRWKASGTPITGPAELAPIEQVRRRVRRKHDLGPGVATDLIVWGMGEPAEPYLTKVGGIPYRPADVPWPGLDDEDPMTFFAQFCFADSRDLLPVAPPGDVMLVFFRDEESGYDEDEEAIRIEWYDLGLPNPVTARKCPKPGFPVPKLYGALHRTKEYPGANPIFRNEGHNGFYYFATTQASRIGGETHFIQDDPRGRGESLLCTLSSLEPSKGAHPFLNHPRPLTERQREKMTFLFGDVGCLYFLIDKKGRVRVASACY